MSLPEYNEETLDHLRRYADIAVTAMENGANTPWRSGGEYNWPELGLVALALASLPDTDREDFRLRLETLVDQFPEEHRDVPAILYHATEGLRAAVSEASTGAAPDGSWREAVQDAQWESVRHVLAHSLIRYAQLLPATAAGDAPQIMLLHARHADGWGLEDRHILGAVLEIRALNGMENGQAQSETLEHLVKDTDLRIDALRYIADMRPEDTHEGAPAAEEAAFIPVGGEAAGLPEPAGDGSDAEEIAAAGREAEDAPEAVAADQVAVEQVAAEPAALPQDGEQKNDAPLFAGNVPEADLAAAMEGIPVFLQPDNPAAGRADPTPTQADTPPGQTGQSAPTQDPVAAPAAPPSANIGGGLAQTGGQGQATGAIRVSRLPNHRPGMVASILQHLENRRKDRQSGRDLQPPALLEQMAMIRSQERARKSVKSVLRDMESLQDRIASFQKSAHAVHDRVAEDRKLMERMIGNGADPAMVKEAFKQQEARHWERFFDGNPKQREALSGMENDAVRLDEKSRQALVELSRMGNDGVADRERMLAKMEALQEQSMDIPPSQPGRKSLHDNIQEAVARFVAFLSRLFSRRATVEIADVRTAAAPSAQQSPNPAPRRHPGA